jgi:Leucine-rich repeat (LRR) protein
MPDASAVLLEYSNNRFSSFLPNLTSYLSYTSYLSMSKNNITGHIPVSICNSRLEYLDLSYSNSSGFIPSCIIEGTELVVLNLRENNFEGMLPSNITTECRLKTIDLHGNNIEGQLPRGLSNCTHLEIMDIGGNRIIDSFPSWLSGIYGLSVIVLRSNPFYGAIGDIVGDKKSEESFPSLQVIDLASNNFSGNLNSQWFEKLEMMMLNYSSSHERGHRYYNRFRSEADTFYHGYFDTMYKGSYVAFDRILNTSTTIIDLSNNRLEGTIPESIGRLVSLRFLNMSHNAFTGTVPAQLGNMTDLESLDHSCNKLTGERYHSRVSSLRLATVV